MVRKWHAAAALGVAFAAAAAAAVAADRGLSLVGDAVAPEEEMSLLKKVASLMWKSGANTYQHVWPVTLQLQTASYFRAFVRFHLTEREFVCSSRAYTLLWMKFSNSEDWICLVLGRLTVSELFCSACIMEFSLGCADRTELSYLIFQDLLHCCDPSCTFQYFFFTTVFKT